MIAEQLLIVTIRYAKNADIHASISLQKNDDLVLGRYGYFCSACYLISFTVLGAPNPALSRPAFGGG